MKGDQAKGRNQLAVTTPSVEERLRSCLALCVWLKHLALAAEEHSLLDVEVLAPRQVIATVHDAMQGIEVQLGSVKAVLPAKCANLPAPTATGRRR